MATTGHKCWGGLPGPSSDPHLLPVREAARLLRAAPLLLYWEAVPDHTNLPPGLARSLITSFVVRVTNRGRRTGTPRVLEATFVWDGGRRVYISGYPGARDWVANMAANPDVVLHTVEYGVWYDIPATARVLHGRHEREAPLFLFLSRWADGPSGHLIRWVVRAARLASFLRLPFWGPLYPVRLVMDRMPCVELTLSGAAVRRNVEPPAPTGRRPYHRDA